jgi:ribosomal protein S18 acetylase RimI-like enzyme
VALCVLAAAVLRQRLIPVTLKGLCMRIQVRAFEEHDRDALRRLYAASRSATFTWVPAFEHRLLDFDRDTHEEKILVASGEPGVLGFASIWEADSFLHNLFVHPHFVRRGVGRALLSQCAAHFSGAPTLKCLVANQNALGFYKHLGWQPLAEGVGPGGPYLLLGRPQASEAQRRA